MLSKLLQRQVYSLVLYPLILHNGNMAFCQAGSTMSQLTQVVHQFARALEMRRQVDVIYFDFSKAFDQVPHKKLLFMLKCLGIKGSLLA